MTAIAEVVVIGLAGMEEWMGEGGRVGNIDDTLLGGVGGGREGVKSYSCIHFC